MSNQGEYKCVANVQLVHMGGQADHSLFVHSSPRPLWVPFLNNGIAILMRFLYVGIALLA